MRVFFDSKLKLVGIIIVTFISITSCDILAFFPLNYSSIILADDKITLESNYITDFNNGGAKDFFASKGGNHYPFDCRWGGDSAIDFDDGLMTISLYKDGDQMYGGEYRSSKTSGYGYYSVKMKAIDKPGVVSSFFTYIGSPWDEIDIEFLGKDATKVQFNYFHNGKGKHEYLHSLGFDASKEMHEYGFDWQEDNITWYVDTKAVYQAQIDLPSTSGYMMMNVWNVHKDYSYWAGEFNTHNLPVKAYYDWIAYTPNQ